MRKIAICTMLLAFAISLFSQVVNPDLSLSREDFLRKGKKQKTTAWVLLGVGTTALAGGLLIITTGHDDPATDVAKVLTGGPLTFAGLALDLVSIPVFVSASRNKKRGLEVITCIKVENVPSLVGNTIRQTTPVILVKARF